MVNQNQENNGRQRIIAQNKYVLAQAQGLENKGVDLNKKPTNVLAVDKKSQVKAIGMPFDFENADTTWKAKHGIVIPNMLLHNLNGETFDDGKLKAILQHDFHRAVVSRNYVVYPNEEMIEVASDIVKADPSLKMLGEPRFSNNDLNCYITIISEKHRMKIDKSYEENDFVNLGVILRNSLGGGLALGTDTFTYRSVCQNGAVFGYEDLGSDSMRHYGKNTAKITELMRKTIQRGLEKFEDIHHYYEKLATTPLGEKNPIFKKLEFVIGATYYPEWVEIELKKLNPTDDVKEHVYSYDKKYNSTSLWEVFNVFTQKVWHGTKQRMDAKRFATMKLHKIFIDQALKKNVN